ncbi:MAG: BMP family ABC transporter substrate-binding protein [Lachnospiraceae bacterium]|nr:BMP family ABC transporter substrate-binding protein [Lachnospiraceae bacterium]
MVITDYSTALKKGKRSYQLALTKGEYPYLPALDDILSYTEVTASVNLGLMDIPLSKIVGTKTSGRTNSFADNFMPLLPEKSEFAAKWSSLYNHQIDDGIRDPIVVYEFMHRFYVQEGNKRVSVMKYLGSYSIPGTVTRIIPKKNDDKEICLYYEFLDFYEVSESYDVWFSKEGCYKKLIKLMGKNPGEVWTKEERSSFHAACEKFGTAYQAVYGDKLKLSASDALLIYIELYGYDTLKGETLVKLKQALEKTQKELHLVEKGSQVTLVNDPELSKPSLLGKILPVGPTPETLKIAFLYRKTTETSSWAYAHELGRLHLEQAFGGKLKTLAIEDVNTDEQMKDAVDNAVAAGCNVIFATAVQMVNQCVRSAIQYPKVKFFNCSVKMPYSSVHTYYARMYEAKFLIGAIAAAVSQTDKLGYMADYPIYGTLANINAFALGARMINPYVKVYLDWSRLKEQDGKKRLQQDGLLFMSDDDMITPNNPTREYGLYLKKEDGTLENLATPIWHWGKFYERIVTNICNGSETNASKKETAINYWWGMSADVIDVICSGKMPHGTHRLINFLKSSICAGSFKPFDGLIYSQDGIIRCKEGESLQPEDILTMNWLAENVVGKIPEFEELTEEAQMLSGLQGIYKDDNEKGNS